MGEKPPHTFYFRRFLEYQQKYLTNSSGTSVNFKKIFHFIFFSRGLIMRTIRGQQQIKKNIYLVSPFKIKFLKLSVAADYNYVTIVQHLCSFV